MATRNAIRHQPGVESRVREQVTEHGHDGHAAADAESHRCRVPGADSTPGRSWGVLQEEDRGHAELAPGGQPLHRAQQQEGDRGEQADRGVARQERDHRGGTGHQEDHQDQDTAPPATVSHPAEDEGTEWSDEQGRAIGGEGGRQCGRWIHGREEHHADDRRQCAVDGEVVPFRGVADTGCGDRAPREGLLAHRSAGSRQGHGASITLRAPMVERRIDSGRECDFGGKSHGGAQRQSARARAAARRHVPGGEAASARRAVEVGASRSSPARPSNGPSSNVR